MPKGVLTGIAVGCFVLCAILLFVAYERYEDNAAKVRAVNEMTQSSPLGAMMGRVELKPATPSATKYALVFALLAGAGGVVCLVLAARSRPAAPPAP